MTHTADEVPEMNPDASPDVGFTVVPTHLEQPTAVPDAFDAVLSVPTATVEVTTRLGE